ncbi:MAG: hypothetical protein ACREJ6_15210 [Candidatus Methylomirabilis sp.]
MVCLARDPRARSTSSAPKGDGTTGWGVAILALVVAVLLSSPAWGQPLARTDDLPHLRQLPIFQPGEPGLLYDDEGQAFAAIVPEYRVFVPLSKIPMTLRQAVIAAEDRWFLGYTPSLVAGIWLGYDQRRSIGPHETAGKLAAPIWVDFIKRSLGESPVEPFVAPEGVFQVSVNRRTGEPTVPTDPEAFPEYFMREQEGPPVTPSAVTPSTISLPFPEVGGDVALPQAVTP